MNVKLKYGWLRGGKSSYALPMGASEVIKAKSGRFVVNDGSGRGEIAGDGDTELMGFVEGSDQTCSSTEGNTVLNCIDDLTAVFRIPVKYDDSTYDRNYSSALVGETCDLITISDIQYANLSTSTEDTIIIVGGKACSSSTANDGYVDVRLNPNKMYATGVE